jgi:hypothetical protein
MNWERNGLMKEGRSVSVVRRIIVLLSILICLSPLAAATVADVNEPIDISSAPVDTVTIGAQRSSDGVPLSLSVTLAADAVQNGTQVKMLTQICVNSGVCYSPTPLEMLSNSDNSTWIGVVIPDEDHTYVNYRLQLFYEDGAVEERFPAEGWAKLWSDCHLYEGEWGGSCEEELSVDKGLLPAPGIGIFFAALGLALIVGRRLRENSC